MSVSEWLKHKYWFCSEEKRVTSAPAVGTAGSLAVTLHSYTSLNREELNWNETTVHSTEMKLTAFHWNQLLFAEIHCTLCMYLRHKFAPFLCISLFCKLDLTFHMKPRLQLLPLLTRVLAFQRWDMLPGKFSTTTTSEWNEQRFNLSFPGMCQILLRGTTNSSQFQINIVCPDWAASD